MSISEEVLPLVVYYDAGYEKLTGYHRLLRVYTVDGEIVRVERAAQIEPVEDGVLADIPGTPSIRMKVSDYERLLEEYGQ